MTTDDVAALDDAARRVRLAARELATEHGWGKPAPAVAGSVAGARFFTKPFGPELVHLLVTWPVDSWVDEHWNLILTRAGIEQQIGVVE